MTPQQRRDAIIAILTGPIPEGKPIQDLCDGWKLDDRSLVCNCKRQRIVGGTLLSQYKKGVRNKLTRQANAEYARQYRERHAHGTARS